MSRLHRVLRVRGLRLLVTGSGISLIGDGVYAVAMATAVLRSSGSPAALAVLAVAGLVPRIGFGLLGGVLADRVSRRAILLTADVVRAGDVLLLAALLTAGTPPLWVLVCCVVPLGAASGAAAPAFTAVLPDVVESEDLVAANSVLSSVGPLCQLMLGPALGGVLVAVDLGLAMAVDAVTFAVSALCVLLLRPARRHGAVDRPLPWAHFRDGLRYVRRTPWLLVNLLCGVVVSFSVSGALTLLPFLVSRGYHAPTASFGYLLAVGGAVATVTAVGVAALPARRRPLASSYLVYAVGLVAVAGLGLAPSLWLAVPAVVLLFAGTTAGNIWQDAVLGSAVPRDLRGRVASLDWVAATLGAPVSVSLSALLASVVGVRPTFVVAGVVAAATSLAGMVLLRRTGEPSPVAHAGDVDLAA